MAQTFAVVRKHSSDRHSHIQESGFTYQMALRRASQLFNAEQKTLGSTVAHTYKTSTRWEMECGTVGTGCSWWITYTIERDPQ